MRPIKTTVWLVFVSQTIYRISATRECLYSTSWCSLGRGRSDSSIEASLVDSLQDDYFSTGFLPAMASDHSSLTNTLERLKSRWILTCWSCARSIERSPNSRTYWQWAGPKIHSLLSAHHLIGVEFLTTESDKRMRLLTVCGYLSLSVVAYSWLSAAWVSDITSSFLSGPKYTNPILFSVVT